MAERPSAATDSITELEQVYRTDYEIGQDNVERLGLDMHNPVFFVSAGLIVLFVLVSLLFPGEAKTGLEAAKAWIQVVFDGALLSAANVALVFCLVLLVLPAGRIRIGGEHARPEFSLLSWIAMLFAAGIGIGLMFWGVAEPAGYYTDWYGTPLDIGGYSDEARRAALGATLYHWGMHPWAIYAVVGLSLAFFAYNKGLPLTIRSTFYPLLGDRVWGPIGNVIDTLAVLATIFGLATSLGFGAQQAAAGLGFLFGLSGGLIAQLAIIGGVTGLALVSVLRGINGGVKLLSNINIVLALLLMSFVIVAGSITAFGANLLETVGGYARYMLPLSSPIGRQDETFYHEWTIFYWAWWISWSPFVGMFIARVSRGRTIRQFLAAVLFVPTAITAIWMAAFGGSGIDQIEAGIGSLANGIGDDALVLFQMLENLPLASITSMLGIVLVLVFFVTSSDSGSLVIDSITSGGKTDAPVTQRVFWVTMEGAIAAVLLSLGGKAALDALQAGAVSTGLPFTFVLLMMCVSLALGLRHEVRLARARA